MTSYFQRLEALTAARGRLCVGIDPHASLLHGWGLDDDVAGLERFSRAVVAALADHVAAFKPQSAFFERFGSAGIAVLERVLGDIAQAGVVSLLDAKRGDIGSTMGGYARAYLAEGAPLAVDAITLSPYLGYESLRPAIDLAASTGRGVYVLARTSNPEGGSVQLASSHGRSIAQQVVDLAQQDNAAGQRHVGLVVGGTHEDLGVDLAGFAGSVLVPGIGTQGGTLSGVAARFGEVATLPTVSRQVLSAGPDSHALRDSVAQVLAT